MITAFQIILRHVLKRDTNVGQRTFVSKPGL